MAKLTDLQRAVNALNDKQAAYNALWRYYDGDQPIAYSSEKARQLLRALNAHLVENWCAVVVDAVLYRLNLLRFTVEDDPTASDILNRQWELTELNIDENEAHLAALVCGESFIFVWPGETEAAGGLQAYYHDPRLVHMFYDPTYPRLKRYAAKWWSDEDNTRRYLTLYYPDRIEYYSARINADNIVSASAFQPIAEPATNPYGIVPIFHLRRQRRRITSELINIVPLQDIINKTLRDMMVTSEFYSYRQRWIISDADTSQVNNEPGALIQIPAGDGVSQGSQVGEFSQSSPDVYLKIIDHLASSAAIISGTPKHYLFQQGGTPSGEALIAMESALNHKVQGYIEKFSATWRKVAAFILQLSGRPVPEERISAVFEPVETVQPFTESQIRQNAVSAGIPLHTQLRREGWSDAQLDQLNADRELENTQQQNNLAQALANAQRQFDQGDNTVTI